MQKLPFTTRRRFLSLATTTAAGAALAACGTPQTQSNAPRISTDENEPAVSNADQALERLMTGNQRFSNVMSKFPHQAREWRLRQASGQSPFAIIFSCVDSRVPPELVFDRGIGDLFVIRTAGHVIDNAALGSIEFGVEELHIPLIMVLGHQSCGAVAATIAALDQHTPTPDQINSLVAAITPAVEQARGQTGDRLDNAVRANIALTVERLRTVPLLGEAPEQQRVKLVGARYDLHTGGVEVTHM